VFGTSARDGSRLDTRRVNRQRAIAFSGQRIGIAGLRAIHLTDSFAPLALNRMTKYLSRWGRGGASEVADGLAV
jgi:hypothetical protein